MDTGSRTTSARIALFNYGAALLFLTFLALGLTLGGGGNDLLGPKLMAVPLWFLALGGLNALYRRPTVERRLTVRSLEHTLLHASMFCAVLAIMWWIPANALADILRALAILGAVFVPWRLWEIYRQILDTREDLDG